LSVVLRSYLLQASGQTDGQQFLTLIAAVPILTWYAGDTEDMRGRDMEGIEDISWVVCVHYAHLAAVMLRGADPEEGGLRLTLLLALLH
jgi:hypothetical protein